MFQPPEGMIDMHTHAIDPDVPDLNGEFPGHWPTAVRRADGRLAIAVGSRPYRVVDDRCWSAERRLTDMDEEGVAAQVLSPMPATLLHGNDPVGAAVLAAGQNDFLARLCAEAPDRFQAFGAVPLQDTEAAVAELRRCLDQGFLGVVIGTRVGVRDRMRPCGGRAGS
ncbi:amidohydrolase family protein [Streptomyces canus]|uniref:amidohydrolase family protein n=1 Tax=Streptomyces canus TaxID=58343 RepID=UPI002B1DFA91|nr:amidohydrolase family protein [Streptomyces canus]